MHMRTDDERELRPRYVVALTPFRFEVVDEVISPELRSLAVVHPVRALQPPARFEHVRELRDPRVSSHLVDLVDLTTTMLRTGVAVPAPVEITVDATLLHDSHACPGVIQFRAHVLSESIHLVYQGQVASDPEGGQKCMDVSVDLSAIGI